MLTEATSKFLNVLVNVEINTNKMAIFKYLHKGHGIEITHVWISVVKRPGNSVPSRY